MCIGELNCPSLEYVYDMTWAEYLIRLYAYNRQQENVRFLVREMAWASLVGPHQNPKKMPKSKEAFWPMKEATKVAPTDLMLERMRIAKEKYAQEMKLKSKI